MRISINWAFGLLALLAVSCRPLTTDVQPIVIDLSAAKTASPAASPTPTPTRTAAVERPAAAPTSTATPAPAPPTPAGVAEPPAPRPEVSSARPPEEVAQRRIEAYNRGELEEIVRLYAPDAKLYEPPDRLLESGLDQIRQAYARRFASAPGARITVSQRMTQGSFVVDREIWFGGSGRQETSLVISEIRDGRIVRSWTVR